jgi:hypothetical protein
VGLFAATYLALDHIRPHRKIRRIQETGGLPGMLTANTISHFPVLRFALPDHLLLQRVYPFDAPLLYRLALPSHRQSLPVISSCLGTHQETNILGFKTALLQNHHHLPELPQSLPFLLSSHLTISITKPRQVDLEKLQP